jgi:hypothetical protein
MAQGQSILGGIITIVVGAVLLVVAILKPPFLWDFEGIVSLRGSFGDTFSRILFGVAGGVIIVTGLVQMFRSRS